MPTWSYQQIAAILSAYGKAWYTLLFLVRASHKLQIILWQSRVACALEGSAATVRVRTVSEALGPIKHR